MKITNPATGAVITDVPEDGAFAVRKKYERARAAQPAWAATPIKKRVAAIRDALQRYQFNAAVKVALAWRGVPVRGDVRAPLLPLSPVNVADALSRSEDVAFAAAMLIGCGLLLRTFRRAVPFFIGMVVGDMLSEGLWGAFAAWVALAPQ